jgi:hypothetical protein
MKVCFAALGAYPLFDPAVEHAVGGIETRSFLFAQALAKLPGCQVSFLV